ncbi:MAG: hypothetical protein WAS51_02950 [Ilumatobacteraceae bacterium]
MSERIHMQPEPEGSRIGATEAWVPTPGWSVELLSHAGDFVALPVTAIRVLAVMGGGTLVVDGAQVTTDAGTEVLDIGSHGTVVRFNLG